MIVRLLVAVFVAFGLSSLSGNVEAKPSGPKVSVKTKYYKITGRKAKDFALSMSKRGPYSRQHKRRAWATASRDLSYRLFHQKIRGKCRIKRADVTMKITYTMPKLTTRKGVSSREYKNWRRMYALLDKHEKVHGSYFKQLASKAHKRLNRLRPARNCRQLEKNALNLMKKLSDEDSRRNDRFDAKDTRNYSRMTKIYGG